MGARVADLFAPWRDAPAALAARHVGREEVCDAIRNGARAFVQGRRPVHLLLFGPTGSGASHLLALLWPELVALGEAAGVPVAFVPDDLPLASGADEVVAAICSRVGGSGLPRCLVLFDGFARQLQRLDEPERRRLRQVLDDSGAWLVATGRSLADGFTSRDTAFYGQFSPWPQPPLPRACASALLTHGDRGGALPGSRLDVLLALAEGNPRALLALATAHGRDPGASAAELLARAVAALQADLRARFRGLSPLGQQLLHHLAAATGPRTPGQLAPRVRASAKVAATAARRLGAEGVLTSERQGREVYLQIADPLFRIWLATRLEPWGQARIHRHLELLEAALQHGASPEHLDRGLGQPWARRALGTAAEACVRAEIDAGGDLDGLSHRLAEAVGPMSWGGALALCGPAIFAEAAATLGTQPGAHGLMVLHRLEPQRAVLLAQQAGASALLARVQQADAELAEAPGRLHPEGQLLSELLPAGGGEPSPAGETARR